MKMLLVAVMLALATPAQANWFEDIRKNREKRAAEKLEEQRVIKKEAEKMRKRIWREKQWSKVFDGMKGFLAKGRFKYLIIGFTSGTILTASGIWYFCHDGCRLFNPKDDETPPPTTISIHQHQAPNAAGSPSAPPQAPSLPPEPELPELEPERPSPEPPEFPEPELPEL